MVDSVNAITETIQHREILPGVKLMAPRVSLESIRDISFKLYVSFIYVLPRCNNFVAYDDEKIDSRRLLSTNRIITLDSIVSNRQINTILIAYKYDYRSY